MMIDTSYYKNMPAKNILNDDEQQRITTNSFANLTNSTLENMIINSNLENGGIIK